MREDRARGGRPGEEGEDAAPAAAAGAAQDVEGEHAPEGAWILERRSQGEVRLWNARLPRPRALAAEAAAFSPDGRSLALLRTSGALELCAMAGTGCRALGRLDSPTGTVSFAPRRWVATTGDGLTLWDPATGEVRRLGAHASWAPAFSSDARFVARVEGNRLHVVDLDGGPGTTIDGFMGYGSQVAFAPGSHRLAWSDRDSAFVHDLDTGERRRLDHGPDGAVGVAFAPDGRTLATSGGRRVRLWPLPAGEPRVLEAGIEEIAGAWFSPDGRFLAAGGKEGFQLWDLADGSTRSFRGTFGAELSPAGDRFVYHAGEGRVVVHDIAANADRVFVVDGSVLALAIDPGGRVLARAVRGGRYGVALWEPAATSEVPADASGARRMMDELTSAVLDSADQPRSPH